VTVEAQLVLIAKARRAQLLQPSPPTDLEGFMFLEVWVSMTTLLTVSKLGCCQMYVCIHMYSQRTPLQ